MTSLKEAVEAEALDLQRVLDIAGPSLDHLPEQGLARARSRINEQKRAIVRELESPTGNLPDLVRLIVAPELTPAPAPAARVTFINPSIGHNPCQAYAVRLSLGPCIRHIEHHLFPSMAI